MDTVASALSLPKPDTFTPQAPFELLCLRAGGQEYGPPLPGSFPRRHLSGLVCADDRRVLLRAA